MNINKIKSLEDRAMARKSGLVDDRVKPKSHKKKYTMPGAFRKLRHGQGNWSELEFDDEPPGQEGLDGFGRKTRQDLRGDHPRVDEFAHGLVNELMNAGSDKLLSILGLRKAAFILETQLSRIEVQRHRSGR
jgi:hypothetical protein